MNMKLALELPERTMCVFVNYVYVAPDGMAMGVTDVNGDALLDGFKICKGAEGYEESRSEI